MSALLELAARCEQAQRPYTGLDRMIGEATGIGARAVRLRGQQLTEYPSFTASLDAAITLVPEGASITVSGGGSYKGGNWAHVCLPNEGPIPEPFKGNAATPALALCAAALKARGETA